MAIGLASTVKSAGIDKATGVLFSNSSTATLFVASALGREIVEGLGGFDRRDLVSMRVRRGMGVSSSFSPASTDARSFSAALSAAADG